MSQEFCRTAGSVILRTLTGAAPAGGDTAPFPPQYSPAGILIPGPVR
jgi:hypothetical protein